MMKMTKLQPTTKKKMNKRPARRHMAFALAALTLALPAAASDARIEGAHIAGGQFGGRPTTTKERTIDGKVVNKAETPLPGSVVYLKDTRSLSVKTYICDDAGHFHFGQLSQNTDYDLWADSNGTRSKTKSISSFDDKSSYYFTLTIAN